MLAHVVGQQVILLLLECGVVKSLSNILFLGIRSNQIINYRLVVKYSVNVGSHSAGIGHTSVFCPVLQGVERAACGILLRECAAHMYLVTLTVSTTFAKTELHLTCNFFTLHYCPYGQQSQAGHFTHAALNAVGVTYA